GRFRIHPRASPLCSLRSRLADSGLGGAGRRRYPRRPRAGPRRGGTSGAPAVPTGKATVTSRRSMQRDTPSMTRPPTRRTLSAGQLYVVMLPIMIRVAWLRMRAEILKGHLDGILLAVLEPGPLHGYAIMEALRVRSGGQVDLPTGTVYPAL